MKFNKQYWDKLDEEIGGWQSEAEGRFLIENVKGTVYVEIGVAYGKSIKLVEHHYPDMKLHGIELINHGVKLHRDGGMHYGDANKIVLDVQDESIDTLFIDGDHTYEGVKKDIEAWMPKVKKGGTIIFHDYKRDRAHEGVEQAVDEIKSQLSTFRCERYICAGEKI